MESAKSPVLVKELGKYEIVDISFGFHHSAILTASGQVLSMGSNAKGQYGSGHTKQRDAVTVVKYGLEDEQISVCDLLDTKIKLCSFACITLHNSNPPPPHEPINYLITNILQKPCGHP